MVNGASRRRSITTVLIVLLAVAAGVSTAGLLGMAGPASAQESPLEPLDTTSPQATLSSFLDQVVEVEEAALAAFDNPSDATRKSAQEALDAVEVLFDLSEVPDTARDERLTRSFVSLADILLRIELPPLASVPDDTEVDADELTFWVVPGTGITLV